MIEDSLLEYKVLNDSVFEIVCKYDKLICKYVSSDDPEILLNDEMVEMLNKNVAEK